MFSPALFTLILVATVILALAYLAYRRYTKPARAHTEARPLDPNVLKIVSQIPGLPPSQFTTADGFNIRYVQIGETTPRTKTKPDLLLIHGIGESLYHWRHILTGLSENFRVTALDLPGFGFSDKLPEQNYGLDEQTERVFQFLDQLNIKSCYVAGHSMGGTIACWMAQTKPKRVKKLCLMAPALDPKLVWLNPDHIWWGVHAVKRFILTKTLIRFIYIKNCVHTAPKDMATILEEFYRPFAGNPDAIITFTKHNYLLRDSRLPGGLTRLHGPILLLYGDSDKVVRKHHLSQFLSQRLNINFMTIAQCGHQIAEEKPHFTVEKLKEFFV